MESLENHGIIIRELRKLSGLSVQKAAKILGHSTGWLWEVECGSGRCRLTTSEFDRIVDVLDGAKHRPMFRIWVANHKNDERKDKSFEGAVLKFIRKKKGLRLSAAANLSGLSCSYLSKLECGIKPMTLEWRNRILKAYGYQPSSFKNLATDPVRSKAVPTQYKIDILMRRLEANHLEKLFETVSQLITSDAVTPRKGDTP